MRLTDRVAKRLRRHIATKGKPGSALPSVRSLAAELGVSINTLRAAQGQLCQEGLLAVEHGRGVFVTQEATRKRVAILCELDILHHRVSLFYHRLPWSLRQELHTRGLLSHLYLGHVEPGEDPSDLTCWKFRDDIQAGRIDAVIALSDTGAAAWLPMAVSRKIPVVSTTSISEARVSFDQEQMVRDGLRCLRDAGCHRVALLAWIHSGVPPIFARTTKRMGIPIRDGWVRGSLHPSLPGAGWEEFREIWSASGEKPDGLLVSDDMLFPDAAGAIGELGIRVPDDLRVVVATNRHCRFHAPFPVTCLEADPDQMAASMAEKAAALLLDPSTPSSNTVLPFRRIDLPALAAQPVSTLAPPSP